MNRNSYLIFILCLIVLLTNCKKSVDATNTTLCVDNSCSDTVISIVANGKVKTKFTFTTSIHRYQENYILFSISSGSLVPVDYEPNVQSMNNLKVSAKNGKAEGYILAPKSYDDLVSLTGKVDDIFIERKIKFLKSYPDSMYLTTPAYVNQKTDKVSIVAHLVNLESDYVSDGIPVYFSIKSNSGNILLQIEPYVFSIESQGTYAATASLTNRDQKIGIVEVTAFTFNQKGKKISGKVEINFQ